MRMHKKSMSRVSLVDLLRRRKSDLARFLSESGIVSYETLKIRCDTMGVIPPTLEAFYAVTGGPDITLAISAPDEGIVVLQPLPEDPVKFAEAIAKYETFDNVENVDDKPKKLKKKKSEDTL